MLNGNFGFELESINDNYHYSGDDLFFMDVYNKLIENEMGDIVENVKKDRSIRFTSKKAYEINSSVFNGFNDFSEGLLNLTQTLNELGDTPTSPCAIHLHFSKIPKPHKFIILSKLFDKVFSRIKYLNDSKINYGVYNCGGGSDEFFRDNNVNELITPLEYRFFQKWMLRYLNQNRGGLLRVKKHTLEFRCIPTTLNQEVLKVWLKIYKNMVFSPISYEEIKRIWRKEQQEGHSLREIMRLFKNCLNISNKELYMICTDGGNIPSELKNEEKYDLYYIIKNIPVKGFENEEFFNNLSEEEGLSIGEVSNNMDKIMSITHGELPHFNDSNNKHRYMLNEFVKMGNSKMREINKWYRIGNTSIGNLYNLSIIRGFIDGKRYPLPYNEDQYHQNHF